MVNEPSVFESLKFYCILNSVLKLSCHDFGKKKNSSCIQMRFIFCCSIFRETSEEIKYGDITIPKSCGVVAPIYLIAHDPKCFPDPEEFRPERYYVIYIDYLAEPRSAVGRAPDL